jgi:hypothetical protein
VGLFDIGYLSFQYARVVPFGNSVGVFSGSKAYNWVFREVYRPCLGAKDGRFQVTIRFFSSGDSI